MDSSDSATPPARKFVVVIGIEAAVVPAWIDRVYRQLKSNPDLEIRIAVVATNGSPAQSRLFERYSAWDIRRTRPVEDALAPTDLSTALETNGAHTAEADLMLWLAPEPPSTAGSKLVWTVHHGEPRKYDATAPYFWEIVDRDPVSATAIVSWTSGNQGSVIHQLYSATEPGWSVRFNSQGPYWRGANHVVRCVERLAESRSGPVGKLLPAAGKRRSGPRDLDVVRFLAWNAARTVWRRLRYRNVSLSWFVAYRTNPAEFVANTPEFLPRGFTQLEAPRGHFYADPFPIDWQGRTYLLVEDYIHADKKAVISALEFVRAVPGSAGTVLERPYHLSYPFTFVYRGELYMIPETLGARRIELYRAVDAPWKWEFAAVLMDQVDAVDTTICEDNGLLYLFTNIAESGASVNDELFLFYSDKLTGPWTPHPANPICSDVRRSRGAGKLFRRGGRLIRPAQDCSLYYGYACRFNEVQVLNPHEYRERPADSIEPTWARGLIGTHTINATNDIEVIDGQIRERV